MTNEMDMPLNKVGIMVKVFANFSGDWDSIQCRVIPKTQKMLLDVSLLNTRHFMVQIEKKE